MKQNYLASIFMVATLLLFLPTVNAQNSKTLKPTRVVEMKFVDVSKPISEVQNFNKKRSMLESKVINNKFDFREDPNMDPKWAETDPVIQNHINTLRSGAPNTVEQVLPGVSNDDNDAINGFKVAPPDTQGDVGPNHYVQMTNLLTIIYNKDGSVALGPFPNSNFWTGAVIDGIDFSNENSGDPIVLYDEYEDRWIVSHFSTQYDYVLFAVSQTGDPTGAYYRYGMAFPNFPDYPKFGIWNDGIYFTVNEFAGPFVGSSLVGFPKAGLYDGTGSNGFYLFLDYLTYPDYGSWLPADADGPTPPPNSTHYTMSRSYGPANTMHLITTEPDWVNPANTVFTISDFTVDPYLTSSTIFNAQPNGQSLASLGDRLMYRLQYRNFGTRQAMVVNQSVQNSVGGPFGVRWYEFRAAPGSTSWTTHQQGTFMPADGENRWMGSIAMNGNGDIALGYSVASSTTHPSIRFTGQSAGASGTGVMDLPETSIFTGTESQFSISRWGDYSMMSVDPSDDDTFWYTQENGTGVSFGWATQIAEITLGTPQDPAIIEVDPASLTFTVQPDETDSDLVTIANTAVSGAADLNWTILLAAAPPPPSGPELQSGNNIHIPPALEGSIMRNNNYEASPGPAPLDGSSIAEQGEVYPAYNASSSTTVYGIRNFPAPAAYSMFDATAPGSYTDISPFPSSNFSNATEIDFIDPNFMYEIDNSGALRKINLTDGTFTNVGNLGIAALGMGVDYTTGLYYAIDDNNLYTIDVVNATATTVGGLGAGAGLLMIGMTFDSDGNLYMYDLVQDNMWSCNKSTGACTVIGSIGFDANFGQGMAWDAVNEQAVLSAFNNSTFQCEFRVADLTTGNTAFVGKIGPAVELTQFGSICIPAGEPPCNWLTVAPLSGTTAPGLNNDITVSVDATGLAEGTYECELNISSNASNDPLVTVPVTLIVAECEAPTVNTKYITIELDESGQASIVALDILEPTTFTDLTSTANWIGYVGVIVDGNFVTGDITALADVKSTIDAGTDEITLQPNFNSYYPDNFDSPVLQGSTYIEEFGTLAGGAAFSFTGNTTSNTLDPRYDAYAFIRIFDAAFDYLGEIRDPLVAGKAFSVQYNNTEPDAYIFQYGLTVEGTSGAYEDEASLGNAVVQGMTLNIAPYSSCGLESVVISQTDFDCDDLGTNDITVTATDIYGQVSEGTAEVTVEDNELPELTVISTPITLWPPNHKYETIDMSQLVVSVGDNCGDLSIDDVYITSVTSDEEEDAKGGGDGKTKDDIVIASDCQSVDLRKERSGKGNGRVYSIFLEIVDENGNTATAKAQVQVPHNNGETAIDDGMAYGEVCGNKSSFAAINSDDDIQLNNYPNPFNGSTTITFTLSETENTTLKVYDTFGKEVATLFDGMAESGKQYRLDFKGESLSKGIYVYHLLSGNNVSAVKKMILIK